MLEHEVPETQAVPSVPGPPASERRVSPEELTAALNALDASKQQAARQLEGTVPIGQVVAEMGLDATPEEIWAQVQEQRAHKTAQEQAAKDATQGPFEQAAKQAYQQRPVAVAPPMVSLPRLRRFGRRWPWWTLFGLGWAIYGIIQGNLVHLSLPVTTSGQTITINGDFGTQTVNALGKDVVIEGDFDTINLQGKARSVTITGDFNTVHGETPQSSDVTGDGDTVRWTGAAALSEP